MCKVNGHSIFSYMFQPVWNWKKLSNSKKKGNAAQNTEEVEAPTVPAKDTLQDTAKSAQTNKPTNKDITSLRVPLNTQGTGSNSGTKQLGLNLLGG